MKVSVELVTKSLISVYELYFDKLRTVKEDTSEAEIEIVVNGLIVVYCNQLLNRR